MITWTYSNGELTWQAVLLISDLLFLALVAAYLAAAYRTRRCRRRSAWDARWRRGGQFQSDTRDTARYFHNTIRRG